MNDKSMLAAIKSEMAIFECSGVRGRILQLVFSYLVNPADIGRSGACFFCCRYTVYKDSFAPQ